MNVDDTCWGNIQEDGWRRKPITNRRCQLIMESKLESSIGEGIVLIMDFNCRKESISLNLMLNLSWGVLLIVMNLYLIQVWFWICFDFVTKVLAKLKLYNFLVMDSNWSEFFNISFRLVTIVIWHLLGSSICISAKLPREVDLIFESIKILVLSIFWKYHNLSNECKENKIPRNVSYSTAKVYLPLFH